MDMSFTKDPEWIKERKKLWRKTAKEIAPELKPRQMEGAQHYFFTGEVANGEPRSLYDRLWTYPKVDIESIQFVLTHRYRTALGDERNLSDLIMFLRGGGLRAPGVCLDEAEFIFRYAFGREFQPAWEVPFLLDGETSHRTISLDPHLDFSSGLSVGSWLSTPGEKPGLWCRLQDYWFSLFEYLDPITFRLNADCRHGVWFNLASIQLSLMKLLGYCANDIDVTDGAEEGQERRDYMRNFRERMEALAGPSGLKELWEEAKVNWP